MMIKWVAGDARQMFHGKEVFKISLQTKSSHQQHLHCQRNCCVTLGFSRPSAWHLDVYDTIRVGSLLAAGLEVKILTSKPFSFRRCSKAELHNKGTPAKKNPNNTHLSHTRLEYSRCRCVVVIEARGAVVSMWLLKLLLKKKKRLRALRI